MIGPKVMISQERQHDLGATRSRGKPSWSESPATHVAL